MIISSCSDFDDAPAVEGQPSGLAATEVLSQTPAAANLLAGTSTNPLDDLVSIFGNGGLSAGPATGFPGASFGLASPVTPSVATPVLGTGLGFGHGATRGGLSTASQQPQSQQDDLLGLF